MQDTALTIFGLLVCLLALVFIGGVPLHYHGEMKKARVQAERQFCEYESTGVDGSFQLVGAAAEVLDTCHSYASHNGRVHDYVLTLFVLKPEVQYFLFKSNDKGNPYVSLISRDRAQLVLKDKYREAIASEA